jgi:hypothetical protein
MREYYFVQLFYDIPNVGKMHYLFYNSDFQRLCLEVNFKRLFSDIYDYACEYINESFENEFKDFFYEFADANNLTTFIDEGVKRDIEEIQFEKISCKLYDYIFSLNIPNTKKLKLICEYINEVVISSASSYGYDYNYEISSNDAINFAAYFFGDLLSNIEWRYYLPFKPFEKRIEELYNSSKEGRFPLTHEHLVILLEWVELYNLVMEEYSSF